MKQRVHLLVCVLTLAVLGWTAFGLQRERRNEMPPLSAASGHPAADLVAGGDPVASLAIASQNREQGDPARLPAALAEHRLELWRLITPAVVSDGRVSDVRVQDKLLILNASGRSRQIWLDFQEFRGKRLSAAMRLKCQQTDREGYFKIVFLPWRSFSGEYYLLISRKLGRTTVNLCFHDGEQEHPLAVSPLKLTSEPIDIRFNFSEEAVEAQIGSQIVLHAPTNKSRLGTPAIAVGGWEVELQKPVVILNE